MGCMVEEEKVKINGENGGFRDFLCRPVANGGYPSRILVFGIFNFQPEEGGGGLFCNVRVNRGL